MRFALASLGLLSLAACQPPVPDNRAPGGVGFGDYGAYELQREAQLNAGRAAPQTVLPPAGAYAGQGSGTGVPSAAELAQAGISGAGALTGQQEAGALPAYNQPVAEGGAALAGAGAAMGADPSAIPNNSGSPGRWHFQPFRFMPIAGRLQMNAPPAETGL